MLLNLNSLKVTPEVKASGDFAGQKWTQGVKFRTFLKRIWREFWSIGGCILLLVNPLRLKSYGIITSR